MLVHAEKIVNKENVERTMYMLWCPGCDELHAINDTWGFNGDFEKPTFTPSILVSLPENVQVHPENPKRCHSFVENGQWRFLLDCEHELKGQTVNMVELPEWVYNAEKE